MSRLARLLGIGITVLCSSLQAQEMSKQEKEVWSALEEQIALYLQREWDEHSKFIHPNAVAWDGGSATPVAADSRAFRLQQVAEEQAPDVLGHALIPVTVLVEDDVAIINFYLQVLREGPQGDGAVMQTIRGHNTWIKGGKRWRLLANYNTVE